MTILSDCKSTQVFEDWQVLISHRHQLETATDSENQANPNPSEHSWMAFNNMERSLS